MNNRFISTGLLLLTLAGCLSAEDKAKAKQKAEFDLQQSELIVDGDCSASNKALDAWYKEHKAEVDPIEDWWKTKSDDEKDKLMADHKAMRGKTFKRVISMTIKCGFVNTAEKRRKGAS